jgi:DNA primase large subunit
MSDNSSSTNSTAQPWLFDTTTQHEVARLAITELAGVLRTVLNTVLSFSRRRMGKSRRRTFYKVPFQAVPDLVGSRRVLLKGGLAYVAEDQVGRSAVQLPAACPSGNLSPSCGGCC